MFPEHTRVERRIPKSRLFERLGVDTEFRRVFEEYVEELIWMFTLDEDRLHMPGTSSVSKIDVIFIKMRKRNLPKKVIQKIEEKMPRSVKRLYFCIYEENWDLILPYRPEDPSLFPVSMVFLSRQNYDPEECVLPTGHNLSVMYAAFVRGILSVSFRKGETLDEVVLREHKVEVMKKQEKNLRKMIKSAIQPKERIERNLELLRLVKQIQEIQK